MSAYYWIPDTAQVFIAATCERSAVVALGVGGKGKVRFTTVDQLRVVVEVEIGLCKPIVDPSILTDSPDDLIALADVNEASILNSSRIRFQNKVIYTSCGSVLMALNPFEQIPGLYDASMIAKYNNPLVEGLASHVFLPPSNAYNTMCAFGRNQSILISGESGAGKTEAAKQCLNFLASVAGSSVVTDKRRGSVTFATQGGGKAFDITNRIVAASPILEAFGNAQTIRNPNSSRFGKWMELTFDRNNRIAGSSIVSYLLEKSRVTTPNPLERNYHIFYQILRGMDEVTLREWGLEPRKTSPYRYLFRGKENAEAPDLGDVERFLELTIALQNMNFSSEESSSIFKVTSAVLLLGNIEFDDADNGEASTVRAASMQAVTSAAQLLSVQPDLLCTALCTRSITTRDETTTIKLTTAKAADSRDSLARTLYDRTFGFIVRSMNDRNDVASSAEYRKIGLLDIFGFEIFQENGFEQLCINYCNEMLQNHFNFVIFTAEKDLYVQEGIVCDTIEFRDNAAVIADIEASFKELDEVAKISGSSTAWFERMKKNTAKFSTLSFPSQRDFFFRVTHYAGEVTYLPLNFLEKNVELLSNDLANVVSSSRSEIVKRLFEAPVPNRSEMSSPSSMKGAAGGSGSRAAGGGGGGGAKSISWSFQNQLSSLMAMLRTTDSHFIRCVKSNDACRPMIFDAPLIQKQLLYSGVFEVIKIQQSGLPFRLLHTDFKKRFSCLMPTALRWSFATNELFVAALRERFELPRIQVGKSKIFYKGSEHRVLESSRDAILELNSFLLQKWLQMTSRRLYYLRVKSSRIALEGYLQKLELLSSEAQLVILVSACKSLENLAGFGILAHVSSLFENKVDFLRRQTELLADAQKLFAASRTRETLEDIRAANARSVELQLDEHATIIQLREVLSRYDGAVKFANGLAHGGAFDGLTQVTMEAQVAAMAEFQTVIDDAPALIVAVEEKRRAFLKEVNEVIPLITRALEMELLVLNSDGSLEEKPAAKSQAISTSLREVLKKIDVSQIKSGDCKRLYVESTQFLAIKEDSKKNKFEQVLTSATQSDIIVPILADQMKTLAQWANIQLSSVILQECLIQNQVPPDAITRIDSERLGLSKLEKVLEILLPVTTPSVTVLAIRQAATTILGLRRIFQTKNFVELAKLADQSEEKWALSNELELQKRFPNSLQEIANCKWQCKHRALYLSMIDIVQSKAFAAIPFTSESWDSLNINVVQQQAIVGEASVFSSIAKCPKLHEIVPIAQGILNLRQAACRRDLVQAKKVNSELSSTAEAYFETEMLTDVARTVGEELERCKRLLSAFESELELDKAMEIDSKFLLAVESNSLPFSTSSLSTLSVDTESVSSLRNAISSVGIFLDQIPPSFAQKMHSAQALLFGRETLMEDTFSTSVDWAACIKKTKECSTGSCAKEIEAITKEFYRRKCFSGFLSILTRRHIFGSPGCLNFNTAHKAHSKALFASLSADLLLEPLSSTPPQINLVQLQAFVAGVLELRDATETNCWTKAEEILVRCTSLSPWVEAILLGLITETNEELQIVALEISHIETKRLLRKELTDISVSFFPNGTIDPSSIQIEQLQAMDTKLAAFKSISRESENFLLASGWLITVLKLLKAGNAGTIDASLMSKIEKKYEDLDLQSPSLNHIVSVVRCQQYVLILSRAAKVSEEALLVELLRIRNSSNIPNDVYTWLEVAQAYCILKNASKSGDALVIAEAAMQLEARAAQVLPRSEEEVVFLSELKGVPLHSREKETRLDVLLSTGRIKIDVGGTKVQSPHCGVTILTSVISEQQNDAHPSVVEQKEKAEKMCQMRNSLQLNEGLTTSSNEEELVLFLGKYQSLMAKLEAASLQQLVLWDGNEIRVENSIYEHQVQALQELTTAYPLALDEIPLPCLLAALHRATLDVDGSSDSVGTFAQLLASSGEVLQHDVLDALQTQLATLEIGKTVSSLKIMFQRGLALFQSFISDKVAWDDLMRSFSPHCEVVLNNTNNRAALTFSKEHVATTSSLVKARDISWAFALQDTDAMSKAKLELIALTKSTSSSFMKVVEVWLVSFNSTQEVAARQEFSKLDSDRIKSFDQDTSKAYESDQVISRQYESEKFNSCIAKSTFHWEELVAYSLLEASLVGSSRTAESFVCFLHSVPIYFDEKSLQELLSWVPKQKAVHNALSTLFTYDPSVDPFAYVSTSLAVLERVGECAPDEGMRSSCKNLIALLEAHEAKIVNAFQHFDLNSFSLMSLDWVALNISIAASTEPLLSEVVQILIKIRSSPSSIDVSIVNDATLARLSQLTHDFAARSEKWALSSVLLVQSLYKTIRALLAVNFMTQSINKIVARLTGSSEVHGNGQKDASALLVILHNNHRQPLLENVGELVLECSAISALCLLTRCTSPAVISAWLERISSIKIGSDAMFAGIKKYQESLACLLSATSNFSERVLQQNSIRHFSCNRLSVLAPTTLLSLDGQELANFLDELRSSRSSVNDSVTHILENCSFLEPLLKNLVLQECALQLHGENSIAPTDKFRREFEGAVTELGSRLLPTGCSELFTLHCDRIGGMDVPVPFSLNRFLADCQIVHRLSETFSEMNKRSLSLSVVKRTLSTFVGSEQLDVLISHIRLLLETKHRVQSLLIASPVGGPFFDIDLSVRDILPAFDSPPSNFSSTSKTIKPVEGPSLAKMITFVNSLNGFQKALQTAFDQQARNDHTSAIACLDSVILEILGHIKAPTSLAQEGEEDDSAFSVSALPFWLVDQSSLQSCFQSLVEIAQDLRSKSINVLVSVKIEKALSSTLVFVDGVYDTKPLLQGIPLLEEVLADLEKVVDVLSHQNIVLMKRARQFLSICQCASGQTDCDAVYAIAMQWFEEIESPENGFGSEEVWKMLSYQMLVKMIAVLEQSDQTFVSLKQTYCERGFERPHSVTSGVVTLKKFLDRTLAKANLHIWSHSFINTVSFRQATWGNSFGNALSASASGASTSALKIPPLLITDLEKIGVSLQTSFEIARDLFQYAYVDETHLESRDNRGVLIKISALLHGAARSKVTSASDDLEVLLETNALLVGENCEACLLEVPTNFLAISSLISSAASIRRRKIAYSFDKTSCRPKDVARISDYFRSRSVEMSGIQIEHLIKIDDVMGAFTVLEGSNVSEPEQAVLLEQLYSDLRQSFVISATANLLREDTSWPTTKRRLDALVQNHIADPLLRNLRVWIDQGEHFLAQVRVLVELDKVLDLSGCVNRVEMGMLMTHAFIELNLFAKKLDSSLPLIPGLAKATKWTLGMRLALSSENWSVVELLKNELVSTLGGSFHGLLPKGTLALCSMATSMIRHNRLLESLERQFFFPSDDQKGTERDDEEMVIETNENEDIGYFEFIDFDELRSTLATIEGETAEMHSVELQGFCDIGNWLLDLNGAIRRGQWFDVMDGNDRPKDSKRGQQSVYFLNENGPRQKLPRRIVLEVQRIEQNLQSQKIEVQLVQALATGREYLASSDLGQSDALIDVTELQSVIDSSVRMRHRSSRNASLFETATIILSLRRGAKAGDWSSIRYWLAEASGKVSSSSSLLGPAPEAVFEIDALRSMSEANLSMHEKLKEAMSRNGVTGESHMKLNAENVSVTALLVAKRSFANAPRISIDDRQLWYSAAKLKNIRVCFLMSDYDKLVEEMSQIQLSMIHDACIEEIYLVKKAIDFFHSLRRVSMHIANGRPNGPAGKMDVHNMAVFNLESALSTLDPDSCPEVSRFFLRGAKSILALRSATKGNRWNTQELADILLAHFKQDGEARDETASAPYASGLTHIPRRIRFIDLSKESFGLKEGAGSGNSFSLASLGSSSKDAGLLGKEGRLAGGGEEVWGESAGTQLATTSDASFTAIMGNALQGITDYTDSPFRLMHFSTALSDPSLDAKGVPSLLFTLTAEGILGEMEGEILLVRDELYHRVATNILRRCFSRNARDGEVPQLDHAVAAVKHLGIKSPESRQLLHTALFIRAVRGSVRSGDVKKTMALLNHVGALKNSGRFDTIATTEVEEVFKSICGESALLDLVSALADGSCIAIRKAIRKSNELSTSSSDMTLPLEMLCAAMLSLKDALKCGVLVRIAEACDSTDQIIQDLQQVARPLTDREREGLKNVQQVLFEARQTQAKMESFLLSKQIQSWSSPVVQSTSSDSEAVVDEPSLIECIQQVLVLIASISVAQAEAGDNSELRLPLDAPLFVALLATLRSAKEAKEWSVEVVCALLLCPFLEHNRNPKREVSLVAFERDLMDESARLLSLFVPSVPKRAALFVPLARRKSSFFPSTFSSSSFSTSPSNIKIRFGATPSSSGEATRQVGELIANVASLRFKILNTALRRRIFEESLPTNCPMTPLLIELLSKRRK